MSVIQINDGLWDIPLQDGPGRYSFPFMLRGDGQSFEYHRTMTQSQNTYIGPTNLMSILETHRGNAYMVEATKTSYIGNGLLQWEETFASIPVQRVEPSSIVYSFQFIFIPANYSPSYNGVFPLPDPPVLGDLTKTVAAQVTYNYSLQTFQPIAAPRVVVLFDRYIYTFGGWGHIVPGQTFLAEDSVSQIYKGQIYEQKRIIVTAPSYAIPQNV